MNKKEKEKALELFGDFDDSTAISLLKELFPPLVWIALGDAGRRGAEKHGPGPVNVYRESDEALEVHIFNKHHYRTNGEKRNKHHGNSYNMALAAFQTLKLLARDLGVEKFPPPQKQVDKKEDY